MDYKYDVYGVSSDVCDAWVAGVRDGSVEYSYGGTRMVPPHFSDSEAEEALVRLMYEESHLKNKLINRALASDLLEDLQDQLPPGYLRSRVGGGRCIMRPKEKYYRIMQNPKHPDFSSVISEVFKIIGSRLNELGGILKLTPDFGRFGELADELHKFTEHVLGVRCEVGGCGGKASYTTSGILGGFQACGVIGNGSEHSTFTLIGSAGALGSGVLEHLMQREKLKDLAICDLVYDDDEQTGQAEPLQSPQAAQYLADTLRGARQGSQSPMPRFQKLPSEPGKFTDPCLERGGNLIMTTFGEELENSNWQIIPPGTNLLLAHNLSLPANENGKQLARNLRDRDVFCLPGQMLTLAGALTSRLEWFWRQAYPGKDFTPKKPLAHEVARRVVGFLTAEIVDMAKKEDITPYEALWTYAESQP